MPVSRSGLTRLVSVATLVALVAVGAPASAHAELAESNPAQGSSVDSMPRAVELTFTEAVGRPIAVSVVGPDGADLAQDGPAVADTVLRQPVAADGAAEGPYSVNYQVKSADGHTISGTVRFVLGGPDVTSAVGQGLPPEDTGVGAGALGSIVAGLLVALGLVAFGISRLVVGHRGD